MHEIVGPEPGSEGDTAKLAKEGLAVDHRRGSAPVGLPDLGHVGHHVVGTGTHDSDSLITVLQLHVSRPLDHKSLAGSIHR